MDTGEEITRWTARLAMLVYVLALSLSASTRDNVLQWSRLAWTLGCAIYLIHVGCAFQFVHHWSNAAAYEATARQTRDMTGLDWGGGLYLNYLFTLLWVGDVLWYLLAFSSYHSRPRAIAWGVQIYLGFIAFNATVVFGAGATRWGGVLACLVLLSAWAWRQKMTRRESG